MGGMLVGSFIFGTLADWIGRRTTLALTSLLLALSGSICALLPSSAGMYWAFATLRFLMGMGHVGTFMLAFTLSVEYVGPKKRTFTGCIIEVAFAFGNNHPLLLGFTFRTESLALVFKHRGGAIKIGSNVSSRGFLVHLQNAKGRLFSGLKLPVYIQVLFFLEMFPCNLLLLV